MYCPQNNARLYQSAAHCTIKEKPTDKYGSKDCHCNAITPQNLLFKVMANSGKQTLIELQGCLTHLNIKPNCAYIQS